MQSAPMRKFGCDQTAASVREEAPSAHSMDDELIGA